MTDFDSSDSKRTARPLQFGQSVTFDEPLTLEHGGRLPEVTVVYETYGQLNAKRDNGVLICHALSGDSHVARHDENDDPGWWDILVGPGKPVDTDRYFVICPNVLGGCRGTTGPNSTNPQSGRPYGPDFPIVTVGDIVTVQERLIDLLEIERLKAVVGGSLGGHMALWWATHLPERLEGVVALATSARLTSQALAFDIVGRNAVIRDPEYHMGQYYDQGSGPQVGLAIARMLGHITYLSREAMTEKFDTNRLKARDIRTGFETRFSVGSYLAYQGDRFVERFDANSYLTLSMALDLFDLGPTPEALTEALERSRCRWLVVSYTSDWLFPAFQSREIVEPLVRAGKPVSYCNVQSDCGHDAFLLATDLDRYGEMIRLFLANLPKDDQGEPKPVDWCVRGTLGKIAPNTHGPTSIFHNRLDEQSIVELIEPGSSVLDLGCGNGGLLAKLRSQGHRHILGIELDERAILSCISRGLDVVQADLNEGLSALVDDQFDVVVLSRTLQTVRDVSRVLAEMLRVGRRGVVSFPNLGYHQHRQELARKGRSPRIDAFEGFHWYDTPNVRFLTIADFEQLCRDFGYRIHELVPLDTEAECRVLDDPNLNADIAVFVLSK